ncbi:MAG TPA: tetratricopeptide repeat protein [Oculatellaceae cyanobacterium]
MDLKSVVFASLIAALISANCNTYSHPDNVFYETHQRSHYLLMQSHQYDAAMELCNRWLQESKDEAGAYACRANTFATTGHYKEALLDIDEALQLEPNSGAFYDERADIYRKSGDIKKALENWHLGLQHVDSSEGAGGSWEHKNIGVIYMSQGRSKPAVEEFDQAARTNQKDTEAVYLRANALFACAQFENSLKDLNYVIAREHEWKAAFQRRAIILEKIGTSTAAAEEWKFIQSKKWTGKIATVHLLTPTFLTKYDIERLRNSH